MKTLILSAMLSLSGVFAGAQENIPSTAPVKASETPALSGVQASTARPAVEGATTAVKPEIQDSAAPAGPENIFELKKQQGQAVVKLKKDQEEAVRKLKSAMKGKSVTDTRAAVAELRAADKTALKALKDAQEAELGQFKKEHPEAAGKTSAAPGAGAVIR